MLQFKCERKLELGTFIIQNSRAIFDEKNNLLEPKAFSNYYDGNPRILMTKVGFKLPLLTTKTKKLFVMVFGILEQML